MIRARPRCLRCLQSTDCCLPADTGASYKRFVIVIALIKCHKCFVTRCYYNQACCCRCCCKLMELKGQTSTVFRISESRLPLVKFKMPLCSHMYACPVNVTTEYEFAIFSVNNFSRNSKRVSSRRPGPPTACRPPPSRNTLLDNAEQPRPATVMQCRALSCQRGRR